MDFSQILVVASPGPYAQTFFFIFRKKKFNFLQIFFVFVNMGPYGSENFKTLLLLKSLLNPFIFFSEFSVLDFWNFEFLIFQKFCLFLLTWDPMGAHTSKRYSFLKSLLNPFKLFLKFLLSGPHKSTVLDFWNVEFLIFQEFCSFSLTWDPMWANTSKCYSSL